MRKRKGFECEQEVRILKYDEAHYSKLRSCDEPEYPEFSNSLVENGTAARHSLTNCRSTYFSIGH